MWNALLISLLYRVAAAIIGAQDWTAIQHTVERLANDNTLTGSGKRTLAIEQLKSIGVSAEEGIINFGIEAAVQQMRIKAG